MKTVEELQEELNDSDVPGVIKEIIDALENAESCETLEDFQANRVDLVTLAKQLVTELKTLTKGA